MEYKVVIGDSRLELKKIQDNTIKCIVTSPPYNLGKAYATYEDKKSEMQYQIFLRDIFAECYRILRDDGLCFINVADEAKNWFRSHKTLETVTSSIPFIGVHRIIWQKPYVQALATKKQIAFAHEFIFMLAKSNNYKLRHYIRTDVWKFYAKKVEWTEHPAVYPVELPRRCITLCCEEGDWVLDPFGGIANTMVAARELNMNSIIIELSKEYIPDIKRNIGWGESLVGREQFKLYQDGLLVEELKMNPLIDISWKPEEDKIDEEPTKIGLEKWIPE